MYGKMSVSALQQCTADESRAVCWKVANALSAQLFSVVFVLTFFVNKRDKVRQINREEQFIMVSSLW